MTGEKEMIKKKFKVIVFSFLLYEWMSSSNLLYESRMNVLYTAIHKIKKYIFIYMKFFCYQLILFFKWYGGGAI